jgi:hypothetical protein
MSVEQLRIFLKRFNLMKKSVTIRRLKFMDLLEHMLGTYRPLASAGALFQASPHAEIGEQDEEAASQDLKSNQQTHAVALNRRLRPYSCCVAGVVGMLDDWLMPWRTRPAPDPANIGRRAPFTFTSHSPTRAEDYSTLPRQRQLRWPIQSIRTTSPRGCFLRTNRSAYCNYNRSRVANSVERSLTDCLPGRSMSTSTPLSSKHTQPEMRTFR